MIPVVIVDRGGVPVINSGRGPEIVEAAHGLPVTLGTSGIPVSLNTSGNGGAIRPTFLSPATIVYPPALIYAQAVSPALLAASDSVFLPIVIRGGATVSPALLSAATTIYSPTIGGSYDTDAAAAFAAMSVQPDDTRKGLYDALVVGLKADGLWSKIEWLSLIAAHDAQAGRLNLKTPSESLSAVNSPTFTIDRGYTGDGASAYLDTGKNYSAFTLALQNDQHWLFVNRAAVTPANTQHALGIASGTQAINIQFATNTGVRCGNTSAATFTDASKVGRYLCTRTGSAGFDVYKDGSLVTSPVVASAARNASPIRLLGHASFYSTAQVSAFCIGGGLSSGEAAALDARIATYLTAIGA